MSKTETNNRFINLSCFLERLQVIGSLVGHVRRRNAKHTLILELELMSYSNELEVCDAGVAEWVDGVVGEADIIKYSLPLYHRIAKLLFLKSIFCWLFTFSLI